MNFVSIQHGGPGTVFPATAEFRLPFTFPTAVQSVHALLQSFQLHTRRRDRHVENIEVSLTPIFDPTQSTTSGEVEIELQRTGSDDSIFLSSDAIEAEVRILVIGI
jgi:hypothetical protein